jgi:hypothetical protein
MKRRALAWRGRYVPPWAIIYTDYPQMPSGYRIMAARVMNHCNRRFAEAQVIF